MAGVVRLLLFGLSTIASFVALCLPTVSSAQPGAWGDPIEAPRRAEPPPPQPNPDWADPPPTQYEERSPDNPDWVEEKEPPPIGNMRRRASEFYDIRYANRDLTLPRGMMRGTFDTVVGRQDLQDDFGFADRQALGDDVLSAMNFGVAISLADDFEIGFSRYRMSSFPSINYFPATFGGLGGEGLVAFRMSTEAEFGDIPFYARFQALDREFVKMGFDAVFRIPTRTEFGFLGGIPLRFIVQERVAFDTGAEVVVDNNPRGPSIWSLNVPLKIVANATDQLFIELMSGMNMFDLSHTVRTVTSGLVEGPFYFIPLGLGAGYTIEARATMMDVLVNFRFPTFYGFTSQANDLTTGSWQVTIGFNVYSPILFKGSAL